MSGEHGDYSSTVEHHSGKITFDKVAKRTASFSTIAGGTNGVGSANLEMFKKEIEKSADNSKFTVWTGWTIEEIKVLPTNTLLSYHDAYGHDVLINPSKPILAFVRGEKIEQKVNFGDGDSVKESRNIKRWNEFKS